MKDVKLTVAIITFNEAHNIERCIRSVESIADEVLIVDSFSTDQTKDICLAHKVSFFEHPFEGHIEQKNKALELARYDCVLSLDADEALDETAVSTIQQIKAKWTHEGYSLNRLTQYCGKWIKHTGWYPDTKLRLVNRNSAYWTGQNPHDTLVLRQGKVLKIDGKILHYTLRSQQEHIKQINYFTDISSKALFNKGKKVTLLKIIFSPMFKFFRDYVLKMGFLDGFEGFVISANSAHAKFLKYVKLYYLTKKQ